MKQKTGNMIAVITADIVNYTSLTNLESNLVLNSVHTMFEELDSYRTNIDKRFSIKRGDNIQIEISSPGVALDVALLLKSAVNKIILRDKKNINKNRKPFVDIRISIGVGKIAVKRETVNESSGDAYIFSGRTLDMMQKKKRLLSVKCYDKQVNDELDTEFRLLEAIMGSWRITSCEVIYWKLMGMYDKDIARKLKISKSAITQRKKSAGWKGVEALLERYKELMK